MEDNVKAFILAAGEGKRMRPLTETRPKPMLHVAGKPLLEHTIESLAAEGVDEVIILTGWKGERIRKHFGRGARFGIKIRYITQHKRDGTGGAVFLARRYMTGHFIAINGDIMVSRKTIKEMVKRARKGINTISAVRVEYPERYGVLSISGRSSGMGAELRGIIEKPEEPPSDLINAGIYVFPPTIFDAIARTETSERGEIEVTDSIEMLLNGDGIEKQGFMVYEIEDEWMDIGYPWDLLEANKKVVRELGGNGDKKFWLNEGTIEENVIVRGNVRLGKGSILRSGTYIEGDVIIGENCNIGPNCYIRGTTSIGNNCRVGAAVEIKNSIIMNGTKVPHHTYIGDSVVGERCNFGSGTKVANLRLDDANIIVTIEDKRINTRRRKLGVIMADDVKTGINSVIDVGTVIGSGVTIGPGAKARGYIAAGARIL